MKEVDITIIGGEKDFNLLRLASQVSNETDLKLNLVLFGQNTCHSYHYDLNNNKLFLNGHEYHSKAVFIRTDVFKFQESKNPKDQQSAQTWKNSFSAWLLANPDIKLLNRKLLTQPYFNKSYSLLLAKKHQIPIPETYVSNSTTAINKILDEQKLIFKPINGGDHTQELKKKFDEKIFKEGVSKEPQFFQEFLQYPELRIFFVDGEFFTFKLKSNELDHRAIQKNTDIVPETTPEHLKDKLAKVNEEIGLKFSASDFKYCPKTEEFKFLEINTNPMFTSFDRNVNGELCKAMIRALS